MTSSLATSASTFRSFQKNSSVRVFDSRSDRGLGLRSISAEARRIMWRLSVARARFNVSSRALAASTTTQCVATTQVIIYITILLHLCLVEFRLFPLASRIINVQAALAHRELGFVDVGRALQRGV